MTLGSGAKGEGHGMGGSLYMDFWAAVRGAMSAGGVSEDDLISGLGVRWPEVQDWKRGYPPDHASVVRLVESILGYHFVQVEDGWELEDSDDRFEPL